ncbi:hypothetical protein [Mycobacterium sp. 360MFTsu5.1]|uniref:hypothetical protein n=1 Tax=Mycobacterium sp. 360MFTsu5.1 TaxID=1172186 RepID=UPI000376E805|nr:hypothetical protein [Mycobacterium sp. 360MFTsu5.1]
MSGDVPVDHECETGVAPTELGGAIVETGSQLAYSDETEVLDYPEPVSRVRVGLIAGGIVAVAGMVVGAVLFVGWNRHETASALVVSSPTQTTSVAPLQLGASAPPAPPPPPVTITTVIVQAPPSVSTKTAPVPTPAAPQWVSIYDQQLFNRLIAQGIVVRDFASMARDAHLVCAHLANGQSPFNAKREYAAASGGNMTVGEVFVSDVMAIYPSCP